MKKYVKVISSTDEHGKVEPRRIIMGRRRWDVKVLDSHPLRDRHGTGTQFHIAINGEHYTNLYYEVPYQHSDPPKWYVHLKSPELD